MSHPTSTPWQYSLRTLLLLITGLAVLLALGVEPALIAVWSVGVGLWWLIHMRAVALSGSYALRQGEGPDKRFHALGIGRSSMPGDSWERASYHLDLGNTAARG